MVGRRFEGTREVSVPVTRRLHGSETDAAAAAANLRRTSNPAPTTSSGDAMEALLASMSLDEKIGQMSQIEINLLVSIDDDHQLVLNDTAVRYFIGELGIGSVLNTFARPTTAAEYRAIALRLQETARDWDRPPVLWGLDSIHGANYVHRATLAPMPINLAATFNTTASYHAGALASRDTRAAGINWLFSPLLGIALEPKWSRVFETFGEDPLLARTLGHAMVQGIQDPDATKATPRRAAACAKHFIGYSMPRTGHDRSPSWIPNRHLYQYFVPAWRNLTALTVMESYTDYDGVPNVAHPQSLQYLLRQRLGFDGVVVTDYREMLNLRDFHKLVPSDTDAVLTSLRHTSIDMSMIPWDYHGFAEAVREGLADHRLSQHRLDQSVRRVLTLKQRLGMMEETLLPEDPNLSLVGTDENSMLETVRQSMVLTKNDGVLPLTGGRLRVLVTGPTASSLRRQSGAWTGQWQGAPNDQEWFTYGSTVLGALSQQTDWDVSYSCGTDILGGECHDDTALQGLIEQVEEWMGIGPHDSVERAAEHAADADVIVVCVGEEPSTEKPGDIRSLKLPQGQFELVRQLKRSTSAKIVLVYFGGRPRLIGEMVESANAVLVAFLPGPSAGDAVSDILTGKVNPSGRLPITYPMYEDGGGIPYFHAVTDLCTKGEGPLPHWEYAPCDVQWPFGHGLSYTTFEYSGLKVSGGIDEDLSVSVTVQNTGSMSGSETVLVFTFDEYRSTVPEYKRLRAFEKVHLQPNQSVTVDILVPLEDLKFVGPNDETHFIIDPKMRSWVGIGAQTDCRTDQSNNMCARIESRQPNRPYVAACNAACDVWKESGCIDHYHMSTRSCLSTCSVISSFPTASMDLANDGWGWKYVDCIESVVWGFQETGNHDCSLMTSMCRNIFDHHTSQLNEFGVGTASFQQISIANAVALSVGLLASVIIVMFVRGGTLGSLIRRQRTDSQNSDEQTIQLTPSFE